VRVDSLALARASDHLLSQYLLICPSCGKPSAAHVEWADAAPHLVRFVCPDGCAVPGADVLALVPPQAAGLTA
jgi:lysyl-tRNA synthetase class I